MYYVYLLISKKDQKFYIGSTSDLKRRLQEHNSGENTSTQHRKPFKLIYYEVFLNKQDAKSREKYLKSGYGRRQLKEILKNTLK